MSDFPHSINLVVRHSDSVTPVGMACAYANAFREVGLGAVVEIWMANSKQRPGTQQELCVELEKAAETHFFSFVAADGTTLVCHRARGTKVEVDDHLWHVEIHRRGEPSEAWNVAMTNIARMAIAMPEFGHALLERDGGRVMAFVPRPPLARSFHLVTTNEQQVAERYDDPAVFWRVWERVEKIGDVRLCIRHLDALEEEDWLSRTIDDTMELARHAKPKLTYYDNDPYWYPNYAAWWEPGDYQNEKAGYPALTLVGYIADTKTVEFSSYITKWSPDTGGDGPWHVLITEIHEIRALVANKQTEDGRPIDVVRVVFAEEWMARQERRPLLDVGAHVLFMATTGALVEISD